MARCEADYVAAELTAVAWASPGSETLKAILGVVELLPKPLEPNPDVGLDPQQGGYPRRFDISKRAGKLLIQRWRLPVKDAITWYRSCLQGEMRVPGYKKGAKAPDTIVPLPSMGEDPTWPSMVVEERSFWPDGTPFWGRRPGGSCWHRLLPFERISLIDGWDIADIEKARGFLRAEIQIDLLTRSTMLGTCHLLLPNPLYRDSSLRVSDDWKSVEFELKPYPGTSVEGLELIVWSMRAWGATSVTHQALVTNRLVVSLPEGVQQTAHAVVCRERGLLEQTAASTFFAAFDIGAHIVSEQRLIHVPARSKSHGADQYAVDVSGSVVSTVAGSPRPVAVSRLLSHDELNVRARAQWDELKIQWFDKDVKRGVEEIRKIIGSAYENIEFIDPYFGPEDLMSFPLAARRNLPIRILTAAEYCRGLHVVQGIQNGEVLLRALERVRGQAPGIKIEVKVMLGDKSPVHDRFLIIDGRVWVLGASVNEFGERGTLLLQLPPSPDMEIGAPEGLSILKDVFENVWSRPSNEVESLQAFVARRSLGSGSSHFATRISETFDRCLKAWRDIRRIWNA